MVQEIQPAPESEFIIPDEVRLLVERMAGEEIVEQRRDTVAWQQINSIEQSLAQLPPQHFPILHIFTPGLYCRQIFMPKDSFLTSKIHLLEHPYIISCGVVSVWEQETGWVTHRGPHTGITKPATRRVLFIHEDTIWTTAHVNPENETDPEKIMDRIIYSHDNLGHLSVSGEQLASIKRMQRGEKP